MDVYLNSLFTSIDTCTSLAQLGIETDVEPLTAWLLILAHTKTLSKLLFNLLIIIVIYNKKFLKIALLFS